MTILRRGAFVLFAAWMAATAPVPSRAETTPIDAKVLWARGDRVYLASADSAAFEPGEILTLLRGKKPLAKGSVTSVPDPWLAVARLDSGSLAGGGRLDKIKILGEKHPGRFATLRIGFPAATRGNLIVACARSRPASPIAPGAYAIDSVATNTYRAIRDPALIPVPWPDTMWIRTFDESLDEEIALERGEIEVAVFWPGELSTHLRDSRHWQSDLYGPLGRGLIAGAWEPPQDRAVTEAPSDAGLAALNRELFHGDLVPFPGVLDSIARAAPRPTRFAIDPALPGRATIDRIMNRGVPPGAPVLRLSYEDVEVSWAAGVPLTAAGRDAPRRRDLFALRCPVVCAPALRTRVAALGADRLVSMMRCEARP